jgi:hypothetical protein
MIGRGNSEEEEEEEERTAVVGVRVSLLSLWSSLASVVVLVAAETVFGSVSPGIVITFNMMFRREWLDCMNRLCLLLLLWWWWFMVVGCWSWWFFQFCFCDDNLIAEIALFDWILA